MIEHRSLLNLLLWHNQRFAMDEHSRSTLIAGVGFDVAQWEIWAPLICGGTLYLPHEETRLQPDALLASSPVIASPTPLSLRYWCRRSSARRSPPGWR